MKYKVYKRLRQYGCQLDFHWNIIDLCMHNILIEFPQRLTNWCNKIVERGAGVSFLEGQWRTRKKSMQEHKLEDQRPIVEKERENNSIENNTWRKEEESVDMPHF